MAQKLYGYFPYTTYIDPDGRERETFIVGVAQDGRVLVPVPRDKDVSAHRLLMLCEKHNVAYDSEKCPRCAAKKG
jgi:hypothetical protein